jgi:hypothetical protein
MRWVGDREPASSAILDSASAMRALLASFHVLLLACLFASAARYQWEDKYNADLRGDAPESLPTPEPLLYNKHPDLSTPPLNRTVGSGTYNHLMDRVVIIVSLLPRNPQRRRLNFAIGL